MPQEFLHFCVPMIIIMFCLLANFVASDHSTSPLHSPASSPFLVSLPPHSQGGRVSPGLIDGEDLFHEITSLSPSPASPKTQDNDISLPPDAQTPTAGPSPSPHAPGQTEENKKSNNEDQSETPSPAPFVDQAADIDESFPPEQEFPALVPWVDAADLFFSPADAPSDYGDDGEVDFVEEEGISRRSSRVGGAVAGELLGVGIVGLGAFVYHKKRNLTTDVVTRRHYQSVGRNIV